MARPPQSQSSEAFDTGLSTTSDNKKPKSLWAHRASIAEAQRAVPIHPHWHEGASPMAPANCLSWRRIFVLCILCAERSVALISNAEIAYVIDPFDSLPLSNSSFRTVYGGQGGLNITTTGSTGAAFGKDAIELDFQVVQTETWGGYVDFGKVASRSHNCDGATHISLWYKIVTPQSSTLRCHLRLILLDDSDCIHPANCTDPQELESYYAFQYILDDARHEWRELRVELHGDGNSDSPFWQTGWSGVSGNGILDAAHIRGFHVEINIDSQGDIGSNSAGRIALDQLACVGGGEMLGAAFRIPNTTLSEAVAAEKWSHTYNSSKPMGQNETTIELVNQSLVFNYTINSTNSTTQYVNFMHIAPDPAYYNLSQAESLGLDYNTNLTSATGGGGVTIQMNLLDSSECLAGCDDYPGSNLEQHNALEVRLGETTTQSGNHSKSPQEWARSGRANSVNLSNASIDFSHVKGLTLSIAVSEPGTMRSYAKGHVTISNLSAVTKTQDFGNGDGSSSESACADEPEFQFDVNQEGVWKIEFLSNKCCQVCDSDKDCIYAQTDGVHCYMASRLNSSSIGHTGLIASQSKIRAFWMDDTDKRGEFCSICECRQVDRIIDCRGRDLRIVPKTFTPMDATWFPEVLDLRNNPSLVHIGNSALVSVSSSLQEVRLPSEMRHIALESLEQLTALKTLSFDHSDAVVAEPESRNIVTNSTGFFWDVCCKPGMHMELQSPAEGLTFCNMTGNSPGIDAMYEPYVEYFDGEVLEVLQPDSEFLSEASESVEKCAAYCERSYTCLYFSYDMRIKNAAPSCRLLRTPGTPTKMSSKPEDFADINQTKPGWISGWVPKTRNELGNARVVIASSRRVMTKDNNYTAELEFSLGSSPLRGAVWIRPVLADETNLNVTFSPRRVALYDNASTATVLVRLMAPSDAQRSSSIHVTTEIESCDAAFVSFDALAADRMLAIDVIHETPSATNLPVWILSAAFAVLMVVGFLYVDHKRRKADSVWIIHPSELTFRDPPEVLGRGTFGLVVLAEYRGTQVAVKRVLPPRGASLSHSADGPIIAPQNGSNLPGSFKLRSSLGGASRHHSKHLKTEFIVEMRLLSKLRHPCITTVMGAVIGRNEEPMLIMEYMDHGSLYDLLHNETMIIEGESILPILRDIAQGLRFLHAATPQVIHGDLKAQNILVDNKFRSKVADFGLSQKKRLGVTGTPFWMAPELLTGTSTNSAATDVYSFGIILYELYSRKDPYEGEDPLEVLKLVVDPVIMKRPPMPASCPPEILSLTAECLSNWPELRPTFKELDARLKSYDVSTVEPGETRLSVQSKKERRASSLLSDVFPEHIALALRDGRKVEPEAHEMVTIFFSNIVGFAALCNDLAPMKISDMLDRLYNRFDELSLVYDVFKVETIGDAYMAVTNLVNDQGDHTKRIAMFSVAAVAAASETLIDLDDPGKGYVSIRVGFHAGPVVANVVGSRNPRYCLFGDTVNTAARMESNSAANCIHCSETAALLLQDQHPSMPIFSRGREPGKGDMYSYWVNEDHAAPEEYLSLKELAATHRMQLLAGNEKMRQSKVRLGRPTICKAREFARSFRRTTSNDKTSHQSKRSSAVSDCSDAGSASDDGGHCQS